MKKIHKFITLFIFLAVPSVIAWDNAFAAQFLKSCSGGTEKSALYQHTVNLAALIEDLKIKGNVQRGCADSPLTFRTYEAKRFLFLGDTITWREVFRPVGECIYTLDVIHEEEAKVMAEVDKLKIPYSNFESWEAFVDRLLGRGQFEGHTIFTPADGQTSCGPTLP